MSARYKNDPIELLALMRGQIERIEALDADQLEAIWDDLAFYNVAVAKLTANLDNVADLAPGSSGPARDSTYSVGARSHCGSTL